MQADDTIQMIIYDNEYQQGASRGTVNAMAADKTQNWTLTLLNGDVSYARWACYLSFSHMCSLDCAQAVI